MPTISKEKELQVKDVMTQNSICCTPETNLREVAQLMMEHDCGEIPVVDGEKTMNLVGVITDRDITCRTVALGKNPLEMTASECMSSPSVNVTPETSLEECCKTMEESLVRRIPGSGRNRQLLRHRLSSRYCKKCSKGGQARC